MARRRRKSKSQESDSSSEMDTRSTASTSSGMDVSRLSNDTDAPFIPLYSEDRTTQFGLFTLYPQTHSITNLSQSLEACMYPLRITLHPAQQSNQLWVGDADTAVSSIMESLPRVVTTPGDLSDAQIRAQIQTYFEGIIDLMALYMPVAALKGYSAEYPLVSGYIDNYLASKGAKPWQVRQMQTVWRSLVVPPALVKYCEGFYKVKQHPRVANMHHFIPIACYNSIEGSGQEIYKFFAERYANMKAAITDYEEFLSLLKLAGYPSVDMPDMIPVSREAKDYELQVNGALYCGVDGTDVYALPNSGYKDRTLSVCRYVHDSGPSLARGLTPTYVAYQSSDWNATDKTFIGPADVRTMSVGYTKLANFGGIRKARAGYLLMFTGASGVPALFPSNLGAIPSQLDQALASSVSDNAAVVTIALDNNHHSWLAAVSGNLTARGSAEMQLSNTVDPNVAIAGVDTAATSQNLANLKEIYEALLLPA